MKVTCEYCDSYVEADENMKCPNCCAPLGSSVAAVAAQAAKEEEAARQREAEAQQREIEAQEQEAKDSHISEIIKGVTSVATAFVAGKALSNSETATQQQLRHMPQKQHPAPRPEPHSDQRPEQHHHDQPSTARANEPFPGTTKRASLDKGAKPAGGSARPDGHSGHGGMPGGKSSAGGPGGRGPRR